MKWVTDEGGMSKWHRKYLLEKGTNISFHRSLSDSEDSNSGEVRTHYLDAMGLSLAGSTKFFMGMSMGKTLQSPSLVLVKPRKYM